jgi:hypothetical protein
MAPALSIGPAAQGVAAIITAVMTPAWILNEVVTAFLHRANFEEKAGARTLPPAGKSRGPRTRPADDNRKLAIKKLARQGGASAEAVEVFRNCASAWAICSPVIQRKGLSSPGQPA